MGNWPNIGDTVSVDRCCREVRLGWYTYTLHEVIEAWNTDTDIYEKWAVVETDNKTKCMLKRLR